MTADQQELLVTFLGTGTSQGIPVINCTCTVCNSQDVRNKRLRTSISVQAGNTKILVDTATDLRQQLLNNPLSHIDAVLYTHAHADHICGIDDLRPYNFKAQRRIPAYGSPDTLKRISSVFDYAFGNDGVIPGLPNLKAIPVTDRFTVDHLEIQPLELYHGNAKIYGYRIGSFAYCTDVNRIPETTLSLLKNLDVLVLDALRETPHPTHYSLAEAVDMAEKIKAKQTYLVHMSHNIDHVKHSQNLPAHIEFAYDGLSIHI